MIFGDCEEGENDAPSTDPWFAHYADISSSTTSVETDSI